MSLTTSNGQGHAISPRPTRSKIVVAVVLGALGPATCISVPLSMRCGDAATARTVLPGPADRFVDHRARTVLGGWKRRGAKSS